MITYNRFKKKTEKPVISLFAATFQVCCKLKAIQYCFPQANEYSKNKNSRYSFVYCNVPFSKRISAGTMSRENTFLDNRKIDGNEIEKHKKLIYLT